MSKIVKRIATAVPAWILLAAGCASAPPKELVDAREAYREAEGSLAKQWDPTQLHVAKESLAEAEHAFEEHGAASRTRHLAYVALRKAQLAEVRGQTASMQAELLERQEQSERLRKERLAQLRDDYADSRARLAVVERARQEAEHRAEEVSEDLERIATVKSEPRGTVITISGAVLFPSGSSELLAPAKARLARVAKSLGERHPRGKIVVEGHTDTSGSEELNLDLSQRRAEAVRQYLAAHGVAEDRIEAKGVGFAQPVAPNETATGRASNRRVEIVVAPPGAAQNG